MAKLKGLGRGLDALLAGDSDETPAANGELRSVAIGQLRPGKYQPRTRMDQAAIAELAESIKAQGLLQPILVRMIDDGYEIIAGERRWRAAQADCRIFRFPERTHPLAPSPRKTTGITSEAGDAGFVDRKQYPRRVLAHEWHHLLG